MKKMLRTFVLTVLITCLVYAPSGAISFQNGGLSRGGDARYLTISAITGLIVRDTDANSKFLSFRLFPKIEFFLSRIQIGLLAGVADVHWRGTNTPLGFAGGGGVKVNLLPLTGRYQVAVFANAVYWRGGSFDCVDVNTGGMLSIKAGHMNIYSGVRYSEIIVDGEPRSKLPVGIILGIDYFVNPNFFLNAEMHNFDQDSLYLGAGYAF